MAATINGIGAVVVVAELRSAGYLESTTGKHEKAIRALTGHARRHDTSVSAPAPGASFASLTTSPGTGWFSVQRKID